MHNSPYMNNQFCIRFILIFGFFYTQTLLAAPTTYNYQGEFFDNVGNFGPSVPAGVDRVTISVTLSEELQPNTNYPTVGDYGYSNRVVDFTISDGATSYTLATAPVWSFRNVTTDANGDIVEWIFQAGEDATAFHVGWNAIRTFSSIPQDDSTYCHTVTTDNFCISEPVRTNVKGIWTTISSPESQINVTFARPVQVVEKIPTIYSTDNEFVAEKETVFRIYGSVPVGATPIEVRARVCANYNAALDTCYPDWSASTYGTIYPEDHDHELFGTEDSIDIPIENPDVVLSPGSHTFKAELYEVDPAIGDILVYDPVRVYEFHKSVTMEILSVPIRYTKNNSTSNPDQGVVDELHQTIQHIFPFEEEAVYINRGRPEAFNLDLHPDSNPDLEENRRSILLQLDTISQLQGYTSTYFSAVGVVNYKTGSDFTMGSDIHGFFYKDFPDAVVVTDFSKDSVPAAAATTAHELGHKFGMGEEYCEFPDINCLPDGIRYDEDNPPPLIGSGDGNQNGSYVLRYMRAYAPSVYPYLFGPIFSTNSPLNIIYGFMGGGTTNYNAWATITEYNHLFDVFYKGKSITYTGTTSQASRDVINITGVVGQDNTASLNRLLVMSSELSTQPYASGEYRLELGDGENVLNSASFDLQFQLEVFKDTETTLVDLDQTIFSVTTELPAGTNEVTLFKGATPLATVARSENAPVIETISINYPNSNTANVNWNASDADNDELTYTVFYSPDGVEKVLIAAEISDSIAIIDFSLQPPQPGAYITIDARDGFNVTQGQAVVSMTSNDTYLLKQYSTRGPNLSGMCSATGCSKLKRHTLVGKNYSAETLTAKYTIRVDSTPDPSCTVNGVGVGGIIEIASDIDIAANAQHRQIVDLVFECSSNLTSVVAKDFLLTGIISSTNFIDNTNGLNNQITINQTVR